MASYTADVIWERGTQVFTDNRYSRRHVWRFDGGIEVPGSASPHVVPVPYAEPAAVDPEEAFVASLSSCHMLWFLSIAAMHGFRVDRYADAAEGLMGRNETGRPWIEVVTLHPRVAFCGDRVPTRDEVVAMHREAHEECFIAHSVRSEVRCTPVWP